MKDRSRGLLFLALTAALLVSLAGVLGGGCSSSKPEVHRQKRTPGGGRACVDCHKDYLDREGPHATAEEGCATCHKPHGLVGVLKLKAPQGELCTSCHENVQVAAEGSRLHPGEGQSCSACHEPHDRAVASCTSCHQDLVQAEAGHEGLEADCLACHRPHGAAEDGMPREEEPALCARCHSLDDQAMAGAHGDVPLDNARCTECHTLHESSHLAGGLREASHPLTAKGECGQCHEAGSAEPRQPEEELCRSCHQELHGDETANQHMGLAEGMCTSCHSPHAGPAAPVLRDEVAAVCRTCHEDVGLAPGSHVPVAEGRCLDCHSGHGSDEETLLLAAPGAELCSRCHEEKVDAIAAAEVPHAPADSCEMCHSGHGTGKGKLLLATGTELCGSCHEDAIASFQEGMPHAPVASGRCTACHDPHGGAKAALLDKDAGAICLDCHKGHLPDSLGPVQHEPVVWKMCLSCHVPHNSKMEPLLAAEPRELCIRCHGDIRRKLDAAVTSHAPVAEGRCLECHTPHGGMVDHLLREEGSGICGRCHANILEDALAQDTVHPPVKLGQCLQCHDGHQSDQAHLQVERVPALCSQCHDLAGDDFRSRHLGLDGKGMDCLSCHAPHGGHGSAMLQAETHEPCRQGDCSVCHQQEDR